MHVVRHRLVSQTVTCQLGTLDPQAGAEYLKRLKANPPDVTSPPLSNPVDRLLPLVTTAAWETAKQRLNKASRNPSLYGMDGLVKVPVGDLNDYDGAIQLGARLQSGLVDGDIGALGRLWDQPQLRQALVPGLPMTARRRHVPSLSEEMSTSTTTGTSAGSSEYQPKSGTLSYGSSD